jgi:hypothetical protein
MIQNHNPCTSKTNLLFFVAGNVVFEDKDETNLPGSYEHVNDLKSKGLEWSERARFRRDKLPMIPEGWGY